MEATATLPRFWVIRSNYNTRYLQHHITWDVPNVALQFGGGDIFDLIARLEMVPATIGGGLYNIKSMHNNKFLSHLGDGHMWITAVADVPDEDQYSETCTLFKPVLVYPGGDDKTIRLRHVKTGCYACLWRVGPPFNNCLYTAVPTPDGSGCDVYSIINWEETLAALIAEKQALQEKVAELTSKLEECSGSEDPSTNKYPWMSDTNSFLVLGLVLWILMFFRSLQANLLRLLSLKHLGRLTWVKTIQLTFDQVILNEEC